MMVPFISEKKEVEKAGHQYDEGVDSTDGRGYFGTRKEERGAKTAKRQT